MDINKMRDKVVAWRGGGWDGCLWEPNFGIIDGEGRYWPAVSTGHRAIKDREELAEVLAGYDMVPPGRGGVLPDGVEEYHTVCTANDDCRSPLEVYDVSDAGRTEAVCLYLQESYRDDYLIELYHEMERCGYSPRMRCSNCGKTFGEPDGGWRSVQFSGYHGDGGIGVVYTGPLCDACGAMEECPTCGDRYYSCDGQGDAYEYLERRFGWCPECADDRLGPDLDDLVKWTEKHGTEPYPFRDSRWRESIAAVQAAVYSDMRTDPMDVLASEAARLDDQWSARRLTAARLRRRLELALGADEEEIERIAAEIEEEGL